MGGIMSMTINVTVSSVVTALRKLGAADERRGRGDEDWELDCEYRGLNRDHNSDAEDNQLNNVNIRSPGRIFRRHQPKQQQGRQMQPRLELSSSSLSSFFFCLLCLPNCPMTDKV
mmetsp:Transcript_4175/g.8479  ORF Transcript_4175/g.8479 Transcript_4175/m.8479 type:complete len:115 (+) Transcript_4175:3343-3687(+)